MYIYADKNGSNKVHDMSIIAIARKKLYQKYHDRRQLYILILPLVSVLLVIGYLSSGSKETYFLPVEKMCMDSPAENIPKPLIIYVAGSGRTGTTYMYNLVRILLRQRDPNTIHGWYQDLSVVAARYSSPNPPKSPILESDSVSDQELIDNWKGTLDAYTQTGTTVLVKVHSLAHGIRLFSGCDHTDGELNHPDCPVDAIFQTHRDVGPQAASIKRMGWARQIYPSDYEDPVELCRKQKKKWELRPRLTDKDWQDMGVWKLLVQGIVMCHREWYKAAGSKLVLDMPMESLHSYEERLQLAKDIIAKVMALDPDGTTETSMDAEAAVKEADNLRPLACSSWQAVNPITHFHRGHALAKTDDSTAEEEEKALQLKAFAEMDKSPLIRKWRKDFGYASHET